MEAASAQWASSTTRRSGPRASRRSNSDAQPEEDLAPELLGVDRGAEPAHVRPEQVARERDDAGALLLVAGPSASRAGASFGRPPRACPRRRRRSPRGRTPRGRRTAARRVDEPAARRSVAARAALRRESGQELVAAGATCRSRPRPPAHHLGPARGDPVEGGEHLAELAVPAHQRRGEAVASRAPARDRGVSRRAEQADAATGSALPLSRRSSPGLEVERVPGQEVGRALTSVWPGAAALWSRAAVFTVSPVTA